MREAAPIALGAYVEGFPADDAALDRYARLVGDSPAILHVFRNWTDATRDFDPALARRVAAGGATPMISWQPWDGLGPIVAGEGDDYARAYASGIAAWGGRLLLRFAHEMNGEWIAWGEPANAYRDAWHRLRAIFAAEGATNVEWVWSPHVADGRARRFEPYFPGSDAVEWVALDGYNWGGRDWRGFEEIFGESYAALTRLAPGRPVMLAEIGCAEAGGDKAAWIADAFGRAIPQRMPAIRAVAWFHASPRGHRDWRVDSSPRALAAWRAVTADPRYAGTLV
ncbi:MAG TPA: glycosyl hydrolase [Candidatus Limnocylindria bacterium]